MPPPLSPLSFTDDDASVTWLSQRVSPAVTLFTPHPPASWATFIGALSSLTSATPHPLGVSFVGALAGASPAAFAWECPPFTATEAAVTPVQWAVVAVPALDRAGGGDPSAFRRHLQGLPPGGVATFANLGGDATLVVPARPDGVGGDDGVDGDGDGDGDGRGNRDTFKPYAHVGAFVRGAPPPAVAALWAAVGDAVASRLAINGGRPLWLSTAGLGVPWLHVRLDDAPKYYKVEAYRASP
ncbi:hypothetical protein MMPV_003056 [Pyropia vietnamensis]